jgi:hypothetical protein
MMWHLPWRAPPRTRRRICSWLGFCTALPEDSSQQPRSIRPKDRFRSGNSWPRLSRVVRPSPERSTRLRQQDQQQVSKRLSWLSPQLPGTAQAVLAREHMARFRRGATGNLSSRDATAVTGKTAREDRAATAGRLLKRGLRTHCRMQGSTSQSG